MFRNSFTFRFARHVVTKTSTNQTLIKTPLFTPITPARTFWQPGGTRVNTYLGGLAEERRELKNTRISDLFAQIKREAKEFDMKIRALHEKFAAYKDVKFIEDDQERKIFIEALRRVSVDGLNPETVKYFNIIANCIKEYPGRFNIVEQVLLDHGVYLAHALEGFESKRKLMFQKAAGEAAELLKGLIKASSVELTAISDLVAQLEELEKYGLSERTKHIPEMLGKVTYTDSAIIRLAREFSLKGNYQSYIADYFSDKKAAEETINQALTPKNRR